MLLALSTISGLPVLAANSHIQESRPEANIYAERDRGNLTAPQAQNRPKEVSQVRQEPQQLRNQSGASNAYQSNLNHRADHERFSLGQNGRETHETNSFGRSDRDAHERISYSPTSFNQGFSGYFSGVSSGTVDPRNWEVSLANAIYSDRDNGLVAPQQAQIRINEVEQIKLEHQQFLNQNGAPNGNVLSQYQINLIRTQLNGVNNERQADAGYRGSPASIS